MTVNTTVCNSKQILLPSKLFLLLLNAYTFLLLHYKIDGKSKFDNFDEEDSIMFEVKMGKQS